jgi:hypothetical protein
MYLPGIILERYGWPGFVVFAVPNVVGCVAFGYVLNRERSERFLARFPAATTWFSWITILLHVYFGVWLLTALAPVGGASVWSPLAWTAGAYVVALLLSRMGNGGWLVTAAVVYAISLTALIVVAPEQAWHLEIFTTQRPMALAALAPVIVLSFLLNPYLDRTFHRARQQTPSRHAFLVFGIAFTVMIVFTCFYAPSTGWLPWLVVLHLAVQSVFTVGAHLREIATSPALPKNGLRAAAMLGPLAGLLILPLASMVSDDPHLGRDLYLRFIGCYALLLPGYVLLFAGPGRPLARTGGALLTYAAIVLLLAPLYEAAFIHHVEWLLLIPGIAAWLWLAIRCLIR